MGFRGKLFQSIFSGIKSFTSCATEYFLPITVQSMMNAKLRQQSFLPCHEKLHVKTIPMVPQNIYVWVSSSAWLYCGFEAHLGRILIYGKEDMTWNSHTSRGVLLKLSWWTCSLDGVETFANWLQAFIIDWSVVCCSNKILRFHTLGKDFLCTSYMLSWVF